MVLLVLDYSSVLFLYSPCLIVAMMTSKKMMKETPKRGGTVIHDDPRIGSGINTLPEHGGFKQTVKFIENHPSTATECMFGHDDDDVPVRFSPRYIGTTPEIRSKGLMIKRAKLGRKRSRNNYFLIM
jgi:hypothetical protein